MKKIVTLALCLLLALGIAVTASAAASASMSGLPASIDSGETATVTVKLSGTPEMSSALVQVQLGEGLSLVSGEWLKDDDLDLEKPFRYFDESKMNGVLGGINGTLDGEVFKLVIKGGAPKADQTVKVTFTFQEGIKKIGTASVTKSVDVTSFSSQLGDADGDGEVTDWDGVMLARYLAGWPVEVEVAALDIDGDGEVTDWDGVLLDRYLAGWKITIG